MYKFEEALKKINKEFIQLSADEICLHDEILNALLNILTKRMSSTDELFAKLYRRPFYGGSYYDGLKITKADEYDLDIVLRIPEICEPIISLDTTYPGHVTIKLNMDRLYKQPEGPSHRKLFSFLDEENYLNASKVRSWMESLITKTLNEYHDNEIDLKLSKGYVTLRVIMKKSGPANTFHVSGMVNSVEVKMDIDFVPCFVFRRPKYSINVRRFEDGLRQDYFIVPKSPKDEHKLWRLSFQEQEKVLINGKNRLKPALKLLKRLRDNLDHDYIASYYLKTLFLWKCTEVNDSFWSENSLSTVFMTMLESYRDHLQNRELKYYWDPNLNLLGNLKLDTLVNITGCISRIIDDIKNENNDAIIYEYLSKSRKRNSAPEETSSCDTSSFPTWAKFVVGGIAVAGTAAVTMALVKNNRREQEERQRQQQQNEHQNNEEDSNNCSLM